MCEITIKKQKCKRCGHDWMPRTENKPVSCPGCKSPYWDKEKIKNHKPVNKRINGGN